jgi:hexokinase
MPPVGDFLRRHRLDPAGLDLAGILRRFLAEMERGLGGRPSSLPMIPTYIETAREIPRGERAIAVDAGGTNLRVAAMRFEANGDPRIEGLERGRMPGVDREVGREEFFQALADAVRPHLRGADRIGFCFSYPAEITPQKDGRLLQFTKEVKAPGVVGELVGAGLARALGQDRVPRVVVLNDTVATLLAGRAAQPDRQFSDFVGLVCGTGLNAAYVERTARIGKLASVPKPASGDIPGAQVVNTESGSFARGARGPVDDAFDATTASPGRYRHEKTISGAYLGSLCWFAAREAARAGCVSPEAARRIESLPSVSTRQLNDFLVFPDVDTHPLGAVCTGLPAEDARALYTLCDTIVERAAAMVAVNLAAVLQKSGSGRDPRHPVCITVDGTTFWQLRIFHLRVESWMRRLVPRGQGWEITAVEDAPLRGAAIAALTN